MEGSKAAGETVQAAGLRRLVIQDRRQPPLGLGDIPALAPRIVLDLVALDPADAEIFATSSGDALPIPDRPKF